jgi:hypothetical protein
MKIQVIKKAERKPSSYSGCAWVIEDIPAPAK